MKILDVIVDAAFNCDEANVSALYLSNSDYMELLTEIPGIHYSSSSIDSQLCDRIFGVPLYRCADKPSRMETIDVYASKCGRFHKRMVILDKNSA